MPESFDPKPQAMAFCKLKTPSPAASGQAM